MNILPLLLLLQSPQETFNAAKAGDVVNLADTFEPLLVVTKPLTIVWSGDNGGAWHLELTGSGGRVNLVNGKLWHVTEQGFDELYLEGCGGRTVSSSGAGYVAITKSVYYLVTQQSDGFDGWVADYTISTFGDTLLADSSIGADVDNLTACNKLRTANVTTRGPGAMFATQKHSYADDLHLAGTPTPGGTLTLTWNVPRPMSMLYYQLGSHATSGAWTLGRNALPLALGNSTGSVSGTIPRSAGLLGETLAFQVYGVHHYQSRPQLAVIR